MRLGQFVLSFDFELLWGTWHRAAAIARRSSILQARPGICRLLELLERYKIHTTWATVGLLFSESREELRTYLEEYAASSPVHGSRLLKHLNHVGADERDDPCHFALSLIRKIQSCPNQEIGSHTATHLFCLDSEITQDAFRADLRITGQIAERHQCPMTSLVFPKNQVPGEWLRMCSEHGFVAYRGPCRSWIYRPRSRFKENIGIRSLRFLDAAFDYTRAPLYTTIERGELVDVAASAFLYSRTKALAGQRLQRILEGLRSAARNGRVFHLWTHPEMFGTDADSNLEMIETILQAYAVAHEEYGMQSLNIGGVAKEYAMASGHDSTLAGEVRHR